MQKETILNVFPGSSEQHRLVLVHTATMCGLEHLMLRQETHSSDVGWFIQSSVAIEPGQVAALKMTLSPNSLAKANSPSASSGLRAPSARHEHCAEACVLPFAEAKQAC